MKVWHAVTILLAVFGAIYVLHLYKQHGGVSGVKNGFGMGGFGG
jgi:hypothetical protein